MNIEINLLPEKPKRNLAFIIAAVSLFVASVLVLVLGIFHYQNVQRELVWTENEISTVQQLQEIELSEDRHTPETADLEASVIYLEENQILASRVLSHLVSLLPEQGFFTSYEFSEAGIVTISAQFETQRGAASYLHHLTLSELTENAMLNEITTNDITADMEGELVTAEYLPRYNADYTITMNMELVRNIEEWEAEQIEEQEDLEGTDDAGQSDDMEGIDPPGEAGGESEDDVLPGESQESNDDRPGNTGQNWDAEDNDIIFDGEFNDAEDNSFNLENDLLDDDAEDDWGTEEQENDYRP
ncbi:hypothetical protein MM300_02605 [Evansella sp. LMS18]|uniref:PilN domain-containing protein n=1 Tax=Evansella sp. LMS18 TaxID=2924033 RepID=UPI0020D19510|nr:hypothetical protein [Evansella sp. LMS18]UTR11243.1 hypothetical protein MM300_02605 [Evansella sp. LMS18]